jgi:micrococcal nuclease
VRRAIAPSVRSGVLRLLLLVCVGAACTTTSEAPTGSDHITVPVLGAAPATVVRVIDGDTLDVRVDGAERRVRLFGVDATERGEACYDEATERLAELAGEIVQLLPDARLEDRFGRLLRYVYAADGTFIDEALVEEGLAYAWRDDGFHRDRLVATEEDAATARVGCLWQQP